MATLVIFFGNRMASLGLIDFKLGLYIKVNVNETKFELFKCFIHHLSVELNNISGLSTPTLNSVQVTHLLWADDLVLLGLDPKSLQAMLDTLSSYCIHWGLTVNTEKTAIMVFNRSGRLLVCKIPLLARRTRPLGQARARR